MTSIYRVLAVVVIGLLAIFLTACGGDGDGDGTIDLASRTFMFADGAAFGLVGTKVSLTFGAFIGNTGSFVLTSGDFAAGSVIIASCTFDVVLSRFRVGQGPRFGGRIRIDPCAVDTADGHLIAVNAVTGARSVSDPFPLPSPSFPCCPNDFAPGRLLVDFQPGTTRARVEEIATKLGAFVLRLVSPLGSSSLFLMGVPVGQELAFIRH